MQAKAARILGMSPRQIAYRIQTLNIEVKQFQGAQYCRPFRRAMMARMASAAPRGR